MSIITGKIVKIKMDADKEKKNGGTFKAHLIKLDSQDDTIIVNASSPAGKYAKDKLQLKEGDEVTIESGGQWNTVVKVQKKDFKPSGGSSYGSKKPFTAKAYDNTGAIQGMVLNNAIQLAIHNHPKDIVSAEMIVLAAHDVLMARVETDKLVLEAVKKTAVVKDEFEDDAPTKPKSDDFSTSDIEDF